VRRFLLTAALATACAATLSSPRAAQSPAFPPTGEVLPFIEDDYARALAEARTRGVPLFVETWAPW